jgi:hypothetical protein
VAVRIYRLAKATPIAGTSLIAIAVTRLRIDSESGPDEALSVLGRYTTGVLVLLGGLVTRVEVAGCGCGWFCRRGW